VRALSESHSLTRRLPWVPKRERTSSVSRSPQLLLLPRRKVPFSSAMNRREDSSFFFVLVTGTSSPSDPSLSFVHSPFCQENPSLLKIERSFGLLGPSADESPLPCRLRGSPPLPSYVSSSKEELVSPLPVPFSLGPYFLHAISDPSLAPWLFFSEWTFSFLFFDSPISCSTCSLAARAHSFRDWYPCRYTKTFPAPPLEEVTCPPAALLFRSVGIFLANLNKPALFFLCFFFFFFFLVGM